MRRQKKLNKVVNNFLSELPESSHHVMHLDDLDKLLKVEENKSLMKMKMIQDFLLTIK